MSKHTPGPWKAVKRSVRSAARPIASVHCPKDLPEDHPTILADAALLAAAPEMLALLKHLQTYEIDERVWCEDLDAIDRVVAKAEGRTK